MVGYENGVKVLAFTPPVLRLAIEQ